MMPVKTVVITYKPGKASKRALIFSISFVVISVGILLFMSFRFLISVNRLEKKLNSLNENYSISTEQDELKEPAKTLNNFITDSSSKKRESIKKQMTGFEQGSVNLSLDYDPFQVGYFEFASLGEHYSIPLEEYNNNKAVPILKVQPGGLTQSFTPIRLVRNKIFVNANIFDFFGNLIVSFKDNQWTLDSSQGKLNFDNKGIEVIDKYGCVAFSLNVATGHVEYYGYIVQGPIAFIFLNGPGLKISSMNEVISDEEIISGFRSIQFQTLFDYSSPIRGRRVLRARVFE